MKRLILSFLTAAAALTGTIPVGHAQSPYNYTWCGVSPGKFGARSCYYNSYQQCIGTMRAVGGFCTQNPAYRGPAAGTGEPRHRRHRTN
jgi:Protein of unknown function (DUF3551)